MGEEKQNVSFLSRKMADFILGETQNEPLKILLLCLFNSEDQGRLALHLRKIENYAIYFENNELQAFQELENILKNDLFAFEKDYPELFSHADAPFFINGEFLMTKKNKALFETFKSLLEKRLLKTPKPLALNKEDLPERLSPSQKEAVLKILSRGTLFLTGGPGSGKTTLLIFIIETFIKRLNCRVIFASPTAKAKNRLLDALPSPEIKERLESDTLHGLLKLSDDPFKKSRSSLLEGDLLVIDEASMMSLNLFIEILKRLKKETRLMVVGDENQLPPISSDNVFRDVVFSMSKRPELFKPFFSKLEGQYRQSETLHQLSQMLLANNKQEETLNFISKLEEQKLLKPLSEIPKNIDKAIERYELKSLKETLSFKKKVDDELLEKTLKSSSSFVFLSPIHRKSYGIKRINSLFKKKISSLKFYPGLPVVVNKNNKNLGLNNGDRGVCFFLDSKPYFAFYTSKLLKYPLHLLNDYEEAYCLSIHKSQGSEYDHVFICLAEASFIGRDSLYTAVTRSKTKFEIYASQETLRLIFDKEEEKKTYLVKKMGEINF